MKHSIVASAVALMGGMILAGPTSARAADTVTMKAQDVIAGRQASYDLQGGVSDAMKAAVAAGGSVKPFTNGAKGIVAWSRMIPLEFPVGTETGHDTRAKPEIWSDPAGFQKAAANLTQAAEKLVPLAEADDKAGFAAQYAELGKACAACHKQFKNR